MGAERNSFRKRGILAGAISALGIIVLIAFFGANAPLGERGAGVAALSTPTPFVYTFNVDGSLQESPRAAQSRSPYFWLDSGGELIIQNGIGQTIQGALPQGQNWQVEYARNNPQDTDGGAHPQNIFRLVTRAPWQNVSVQMDFKIMADNFSTSANRNSSNGLLLMSRYQDADTLYYAGVRVDGTAVIKKKYRGIYYTLAQKSVFPGTYRGVQDAANLLPHGQWLTLRSETATREDGSVSVRLSMRLPEGAPWRELLEARDSGQYGRTPPLIEPGYVGVRTDFMDVQFRDLTIKTVVYSTYGAPR